MRIIFALFWLLSTAILVGMPSLVDFNGRFPAGTFPLEGGNSSALKHQYVVFSKIHHVQYPNIRKNVPKILAQIDSYASSEISLNYMRDSLIDFASPVIFTVMPAITIQCSDLLRRYQSHAVALQRALAGYWQPGGIENCTEILVSVVDQAGDQHLDFKAVKRETGRVLILNSRGGALAQIILWRDDKTKVSNAQVQPLDPVLDIGSGFSSLPLDWPRIETHRRNIKSVSTLRIPYDNFVEAYLKERGQIPWNCDAQLLGLRYRDSWGRTATAQWCYGDSFPKILENDHYFAFRIEE